MLRLLSVAVAWLGVAVATAACQTTFYDAGTTPIMLSQSVVDGFEKYKQTTHPLYFAVTIDGSSYSFNSCPTGGSCMGLDPGKTLQRCKDQSGRDCKLFAHAGDIVWKGPISYPKSAWDGHTLMISITHGKSTINYSGRARISADGNEIKLNVSMYGGDCFGTAAVSTGEWTLSCMNTERFTGQFRPGEKNSFEGFGRGLNGEPAHFTIQYPPSLPDQLAAVIPQSAPSVPEARDAAIEKAKFLLGRKCVAAFESYLKRVSTNPYTVFIYADKKSLKSYACGGGWGRTREDAETMAMQKCKEQKKNTHFLLDVECELFAVGDSIVWNK